MLDMMSSLNKIHATPVFDVITAAPVKLVREIKPSKAIWEVEPKVRKEIADARISDALKILGTFHAQAMADETGLTIACVRDKLNALFGKGEVTKEKIHSNKVGQPIYHFKLVA